MFLVLYLPLLEICASHFRVELIIIIPGWNWMDSWAGLKLDQLDFVDLRVHTRSQSILQLLPVPGCASATCQCEHPVSEKNYFTLKIYVSQDFDIRTCL